MKVRIDFEVKPMYEEVLKVWARNMSMTIKEYFTYHVKVRFMGINIEIDIRE